MSQANKQSAKFKNKLKQDKAPYDRYSYMQPTYSSTSKQKGQRIQLRTIKKISSKINQNTKIFISFINHIKKYEYKQANKLIFDSQSITQDQKKIITNFIKCYKNSFFQKKQLQRSLTEQIVQKQSQLKALTKKLETKNQNLRQKPIISFINDLEVGNYQYAFNQVQKMGQQNRKIFHKILCESYVYSVTYSNMVEKNKKYINKKFMNEETKKYYHSIQDSKQVYHSLHQCLQSLNSLEKQQQFFSITNKLPNYIKKSLIEINQTINCLKNDKTAFTSTIQNLIDNKQLSYQNFIKVSQECKSSLQYLQSFINHQRQTIQKYRLQNIQLKQKYKKNINNCNLCQQNKVKQTELINYIKQFNLFRQIEEQENNIQTIECFIQRTFKFNVQNIQQIQQIGELLHYQTVQKPQKEQQQQKSIEQVINSSYNKIKFKIKAIKSSNNSNNQINWETINKGVNLQQQIDRLKQQNKRLKKQFQSMEQQSLIKEYQIKSQNNNKTYQLQNLKVKYNNIKNLIKKLIVQTQLNTFLNNKRRVNQQFQQVKNEFVDNFNLIKQFNQSEGNNFDKFFQMFNKIIFAMMFSIQNRQNLYKQYEKIKHELNNLKKQRFQNEKQQSIILLYEQKQDAVEKYNEILNQFNNFISEPNTNEFLLMKNIQNSQAQQNQIQLINKSVNNNISTLKDLKLILKNLRQSIIKIIKVEDQKIWLEKQYQKVKQQLKLIKQKNQQNLKKIKPKIIKVQKNIKQDKIEQQINKDNLQQEKSEKKQVLLQNQKLKQRLFELKQQIQQQKKIRQQSIQIEQKFNKQLQILNTFFVINNGQIYQNNNSTIKLQIISSINKQLQQISQKLNDAYKHIQVTLFKKTSSKNSIKSNCILKKVNDLIFLAQQNFKKVETDVKNQRLKIKIKQKKKQDSGLSQLKESKPQQQNITYIQEYQSFFKQKNQKLIKQLQNKEKKILSLQQELKVIKQKQNQWIIQKLKIKKEAFFVGQILDFDPQTKYYLIEEIEKQSKLKIKRTKFLYRFDRLNKINFHQYLDNHPNLIVVIKTSKGNLIAAYSKDLCRPGQNSTGPGFICSLTNKKIFLPNYKNPSYRCISYDQYYMIFGNSQIRLITYDDNVYSNFAIVNSYFDCKGQTVNVLFGEGQKQRSVKIQTYEFFEIEFEKK